MRKLISNYDFDATNRLIKFNDYTVIYPVGLLLIVNTMSNTTIYQFNDSNLGGTVSFNILTLSFNTSAASMNNCDSLQIWYDDGIDANSQIIKLLSDISSHLIDMKEMMYDKYKDAEEEQIIKQLGEN